MAKAIKPVPELTLTSTSINMQLNKYKKYFFNCFLLVIPVLIWNIILASKLPVSFQHEIFNDKIPALIVWGESSCRVVIFLLTMLMPLPDSVKEKRGGFILYAAGLSLYFTSWIALIYYPDNSWSRSLAGFSAPSYTPLFWLAGIGWTGGKFYFRFTSGKLIFIIFSMLFLLFHNAHTLIVYSRTH